jgi:hypothetical protein
LQRNVIKRKKKKKKKKKALFAALQSNVAFFKQDKQISGRRRRPTTKLLSPSFCFFRYKNKKKKAYMGRAWVRLRLQPQLPSSYNSSKLQALAAPSSKLLLQAPAQPASPPAPSSVLFNVGGALAME